MIRDPSRTRTALLAQRHATSALGARTSALWQRLRQDRLPLTASSLTYTTVLALVPLFTVILSVFTMFPIFAEMQGALQQSLVDSLIPESIAGNVMRYLNEFAGRAGQLGLLGIAGLVVTSLSLILTIDKTLNQIWRADKKRPLGQRVLVYWAALTFGPLILGASLAITSYVATASRGLIPGSSAALDGVLQVLQFALMTCGVMFLYRFVPNTSVRWRHALAGALFVTLVLGLARWGMGIYLARVETYSTIYGAFSVLPILLLWIYLAWLIVLFGAAIAAYLPAATSAGQRRTGVPGWEFQLAIEVLQQLALERAAPQPGLTASVLAARLRVDVLELGRVLEALRGMEWVGLLAARRENEERRHVLLIDPAERMLQPLADTLLIAPGPVLARWWGKVPLAQVTVAEALVRESTG